MSEHKGATPLDWGHFDMVLGLGGNLLPVVPDPNATPAPNSKVKKFGKIPSQYDADGRAFGLKDWSTRDILHNEQVLWMKDPRLGICVRTGSRSGVYAIDVDVSDPEMAQRLRKTISAVEMPERRRANSSKFLVPFELVGSPKLDKRIIELPSGERIEFLADGQQFVAAGTHPSGARYEWHPGPLPSAFMRIPELHFEDIWMMLSLHGKVKLASTPLSPSEGGGTIAEISDDDFEMLKSALAWPKLKANCSDNDSWSEIGYALLTLRDRGRALFCEWSKSVPNYAAGGPESWWDTHCDQAPRSDFRHVFALARKLGWGSVAPTTSFEPVVPQNPADPLDLANAPPQKPRLRLTATNARAQIVQAEKVMRDHMYAQGNQLVRIGRARELEDGETERSGDYRSIIRMTPEFLMAELPEVAIVEKWDAKGKEFVPSAVPKLFAESVINQRDWPNTRPLTAIARAPFVRSDGSICDKPGYDHASQAFYMPSTEFPKLPELITRDDAMAALRTLCEPFDEFPFATRSAQSAFVSHVLTEATRVAVDCAPMFWYTAPKAGTGKSLLGQMASAIVHGSPPARRPWLLSAEELRKTLFSSLLVGDRSVFFDNVPSGHKARSPEMCAFLTSESWQDRKLGASESPTVRNRSVVSATGNNVDPVGDLARRSIVVRLDANLKDQSQRRFKIEDIGAYIKTHRVELLMAALTIVSGAKQNGASGGTVALPSFEQWSRMARDPLIWLGMPDPVETQAEETDDEAEASVGIFNLLGSYFGGREFTSNEVHDLAMGFSDAGGRVAQQLIAADCRDPTSLMKIQYWMRDQRDRLAGNYKLVRGATKGKWVFKLLDNGDLA